VEHGFSTGTAQHHCEPLFHVFSPFRVLARVCKRLRHTSYCVIQKRCGLTAPLTLLFLRSGLLRSRCGLAGSAEFRDRKEGAKKRPDAGREGFHKERPLLIPLLQFCSPPDNTAHDINRARTLDKELWSPGDQHMPVFLGSATLRPHRSFDAVIPPLWPPAVSLWPCW
jgi:hypothetical protein